MKAFALVTACLMAAGVGAYYLHSDSSPASCPVAKSGGCCPIGEQGKPLCCTNPCPACSSDCLTCCDACEVCCDADAAGVAKPAKPGCCEAGAAKASAKANCCAAGADCCALTAPCCEAPATPAAVATAAALAGVAR